MAHAVLTGQNSLHSLSGALRRKGSVRVRGGNIGKQVACVLLAEDFEFCQGYQKRLADTEGRHAVGIIKLCALSYDVRSTEAKPGARCTDLHCWRQRFLPTLRPIALDPSVADRDLPGRRPDISPAGDRHRRTF